jgi:hypothetical protein
MKKGAKAIIKISAALIIVFTLALGVITPGKAWWGVPVISISAVVSDTSVTITGSGFPADQTFTVRMGAYGTLGIGGIVVGSKQPASGSAFTATYLIPASLAGSQKIAIRLDSPQGYYSFNWFYNNSTISAAPVATPVATPVVVVPPAQPTQAAPTKPAYTGFPTVNIVSVVKDTRVNVQVMNMPAGETITVLMGEFGTAGVNGIVVTKISSGSGGDFSATYMIPAALYGRGKIAIRMETSSGYYAYNWFYNN